MSESEFEPRPSGEKLQKVLARAGLGSRRDIEQWITDGRVKVNGVVASLGARVELRDAISVDGQLLKREDMQQTVRQFASFVDIAAGGDLDLLSARASWWWRETA